MRRWLLYHIPKTGGTSMSQHLSAELDEAFLSVTLQERPGSLTPSQLRSAPRRTLERVRVFQGHGVGRFIHDLLPGSPTAEVVVLREPAARLVSHYNFRIGSPDAQAVDDPSFEAFLVRSPPDFMLRFLCSRLGFPINSRSLDRVLHALSGMYTVTTAEVDTAIAEVSRVLGVSAIAPRRNVSGVDFPVRLRPDLDLVRRLRQLNPLDAVLFEAAREMGPRSIARLTELDTEEV